MPGTKLLGARRPIAVALLCSAMLLIGAAQGSARADRTFVVTAVSGSAYGYFADNITLFGASQADTGPTPTVALPPFGSATPVTATATTGQVTYSTATFFSSGRIDVSTQGTTGPAGSATSSANIANVNRLGNEVFTATSVASTCTATEAGVTGSTTVSSGLVQTDSGLDINSDGDFTDAGEHAPATVVVPANPAPNTTYDGHIHLNTATDNFRYVFNEQVVNAGSGLLTVNAAHLYLLGPTATATGDVIIGQSRCGVTAFTAATFRSLTATAAGRDVLVRWRTASEIDMLGFNAYGQVDSKRAKLNRRLIAAKSGSGASYSFRYRAPAGRKAPARYWIQVVNLDGSSAWYGPARVTRGA